VEYLVGAKFLANGIVAPQQHQLLWLVDPAPNDAQLPGLALDFYGGV
jgi:hypothetical protein